MANDGESIPLNLRVDWSDTAAVAVVPVNQAIVQRMTDPSGEETVSVTLGYAIPPPGLAFVAPGQHDEYLENHPVKVQHTARFAMSTHSARHLATVLLGSLPGTAVAAKE